MPARKIVTRELASLLNVLSHPDRIAIIEELRASEKDVATLSGILGVSHSRTSQQLSLLRAHHLIQPRRDGRRVFYSLAKPGLAGWLLDGLDFIEAELRREAEIRDKVVQARAAWNANGS